MIFLPEEITSNKCVVVRDSNTIRVYQSMPQTNRTINYNDYYVNSHYFDIRGSQTFNNIVNFTCDNYHTFTTDFYYRNDISDILLTFLLISIIIFGIPIYIYKKLFKGCW